MTYRLPDFNRLCSIWTPDAPNVAAIPSGPARLDAHCNLAWGRRVQVVSTGGTSSAGVLVLAMTLLLPAFTDIRGPQDTISFDVVEVPSDSGRWYQVVGVDDIGKGFSNEHRAAQIFAIRGTWTAPYG